MPEGGEGPLIPLTLRNDNNRKFNLRRDTAMRIINIFALFENPTGDPGWQLWDGDALVGVYRTREQARSEARGRKN